MCTYRWLEKSQKAHFKHTSRISSMQFNSLLPGKRTKRPVLRYYKASEPQDIFDTNRSKTLTIITPGNTWTAGNVGSTGGQAHTHTHTHTHTHSERDDLCWSISHAIFVSLGLKYCQLLDNVEKHTMGQQALYVVPKQAKPYWDF